jgi:uncharacterized protein (TIGR03435 family)
MHRTIAGMALMVMASVGLWGQAAAPLTFEVASIKPAAQDARGTMIRMMPGGALTVTNATLRLLVTVAYDVRDFQISGGPGWVGSERYDVNAKAEGSASSASVPEYPRNITDAQRKTNQEQMRQRLQALLADRFQLTIHRETKEAPVYALVVAKNGPKLQESKEGGPRLMMGRGQLNGQGALMEMLANVLSGQLGRPVLDKTGLQGKYDFKLEFTPDPGQGAGPFGGLGPGPDAPPPPDPNGPSLFAAIQEQLGLRLESTKGPVEMIVIDRVEKSSEN